MNFSKEDLAELEKHAKSGKLDDIKNFMDQKLRQWREVPIDVAITGNSGTGKSSFINAILGLSADDEGAASVGVTETTMEIKSYKHPKNAKLMLWDLPGAGTPNFPLEGYEEKVDLWRFDFYIIIATTRFSENDMIITKKIEAKGKKFFFVRSKIDESVRCEKRDRPKTFSEENVIHRIRQDCMTNLKKAGIESANIYLISSHFHRKWDFPNLCGDLLKTCPSLIREAMTLSFLALSNELIIKKREVLLQRAMSVSMLATIDLRRSYFQTPGINIETLVEEIKFYKEQFGLDETSVNLLQSNLADSELGNELNGRVTEFQSQRDVTEYIVKLYKEYETIGIAYKACVLIPIVTSGISFYLTWKILETVLLKFEEEGKVLVKLRAKKQWMESEEEL